MKFFKHIFLFALFFASTDVFGIVYSPQCENIKYCFEQNGKNNYCCGSYTLNGDASCEDYYNVLTEFSHLSPDYTYEDLCYPCDDDGSGKYWDETKERCECQSGYTPSTPYEDGRFDCELAPIKLQYQTNCSGTPKYNYFYAKIGGICTQENIPSNHCEWSTGAKTLNKDWRCDFLGNSQIDGTTIGGKGTVSVLVPPSVSQWISLKNPNANTTYTIDTNISAKTYNVYCSNKDSYSQTCTFFETCRLPPYNIYLYQTGTETGGYVIKGYKLTNMSDTTYQDTLNENEDISNSNIENSMDKNEIGWIITLDLEPCPANHFCPSGTTQSGTTVPKPCPDGTFSDEGSDNISNCEIRGGENGTKFCDNVGCFYLPNVVRIPTIE